MNRVFSRAYSLLIFFTQSRETQARVYVRVLGVSHRHCCSTSQPLPRSPWASSKTVPRELLSPPPSSPFSCWIFRIEFWWRFSPVTGDLVFACRVRSPSSINSLAAPVKSAVDKYQLLPEFLKVRRRLIDVNSFEIYRRIVENVGFGVVCQSIDCSWIWGLLMGLMTMLRFGDWWSSTLIRSTIL